MHIRELSIKIGKEKRSGLTNVVLLANAFIWYFLAFSIIRNLIVSLNLNQSQTLVVLGVNITTMAVSGVVGSIVTEKLGQRVKFIYFWTLAGIFLSAVPAIFTISSNIELILLASLIGIYFGFGMPATMGYFAASTSVSARSKIAGVSFLFIALSFVALGSLGSTNIKLAGIILTGMRIFGLSLLVAFRIEEKAIGKREKVSFARVVTNRSFMLYFVPWVMFSLVNYLTVPVQNSLFKDATQFATTFENVLIAIVAVVSGFLADRLGRKRLIILGFVMLGIGYAALGLSPTLSGWYFYTIVDGIAWGIFFTLLLFTIWGDVAQESASEKFYVLGALPYLLSNFMRISIGNYISDVINTATAIFSFASFFLFLSVLPLFYAPETLPEKVMKDRDLKSYVGKAIEKVKKEAGVAEGIRLEEFEKPETKSSNSESENESEVPEELPEDEEALRLAEKYY